MFGAMSTRVEVYALAVHPSESYYFVIGGSDRLVRLYDMRMPQSSEEPRLGLPLVHAWLPGEWTGRGGWWSMAQVTGLAWSYDGSRIAASYSGDRIFIIDAAEAFKRGLGTAAPEGECRAKRRRCPARDEGDGRSAELDSGRRGRGGVDAAQDDVDYRHRRRRRHRQDVLVAAACSEEVLTREEDDDQRARLRATFLSSTSSLMAEAPSITVSDTSSEEGASSESSRTASRVASRASSSRDAPDSPEMGDEGSLFRGEESTPSGADRWDLSLDGEDDGSGPSLGNFSESSFYSSDSPDDLLQGPPAGLPAGAPGSPSGSESSTSNGLLSFLQRSSVLLFPPRAGAARSRWNRALYGYQCWNLISMEDIRLADRRMLGVMTGHINLATKNLQVFFFGGARHGCREYVVSGSDDGGIYIWSLSSMKIVQVLTERKDVGLVVPHPCSLQLASSSNGEISFWTPIGPPTSRVSRLERNFLRATMNSFFVENATSVSTFSRVVLSIDEASAPLRTSDTSADPTRDRGARRPGVVLGSADGPESVVILDAPALGCIIQ
ncbi:DDB1- and CUL4-associated factor 6-like [Schistocerca gregaria]|uniref:DDB1- and CUL4-associated factor 6-like n=1 Tax=Schistocerca gregaria TaxID=7010 RepID=UPI00211DF4AD|nr:DDB1- and CUL4-associated factor 6-like [Schistocerca gregaria]XP_049847946.1 DDB1- and CUL4-associated factor 6-like [Schistocerca gregaria]